MAVALVAVLALGTVGVLLLDRPSGPSGTSSQLPDLTAPEPHPGEPAAAQAYDRFYDQQPAWTNCYQSAQCATVSVPVDWDDPAGAALGLAVVRLPATGRSEQLGSLLLNPGGPGVSGVQYVGQYGRVVTSDEVRERYDVVGFDPRGVGASRPVDCLSDAELDDYLAADPDPEAPGGLAEMRAQARAFADGCEASAGELLGHVDTLSAARDMDVLRAVLGDERLSYLGMSYGTLLGATYAGLYPHRVGRMVLDGALDPASSSVDVSVGQAAGMERALRTYVAACLDERACPLSGDVESAVEQVRGLIERAETNPLQTQDPARPLTAPLAVTGIINPLYSRGSWPTLTAALAEGLAGDGTKLLASADSYAQRRPDGTYSSNLLEAFAAVNCLDYPMDDDPAAMRAAEQRALEQSPTFGAYLAYGAVTCAAWPVPPVRTPAPIIADGAPPILVVGTTGDPATPYRWAQALAGQLESGRLLTHEGEGHTAYRSGSRCIDGAVDAYLVEGVLPGEGATCSR